MALGTAKALVQPSATPACRLVVRQQSDLSEISEFITSGIEIGQQIVAMAGPACLKDLGLILTRRGLRTEALIRSGRVIFLTAPECLAQLGLANERVPGASLRLNGSVLRWVSDWSWAYGNGQDPSTLLRYQCLVHDFVRALTPLSLCTVHGPKLERSSLLAMMVDHRRASRAASPRAVAPTLSTKPAPVPLL
jgi:hypothetical protein